MIKEVKAILFDMDGTLVNTEPLHEQAWHETLSPYKLNLSKDWFEKYTGSTDRKLMNHVVSHYSLSANVDSLLKQKRERFLVLGESQSKVYEGVIEGLHSLKKKYPLALVTSSSRSGADMVLRVTGLQQFFDTTITFDDVINHKPDPEPYLKAAKILAVPPENCIAIEDSVSGSRSALNAGCFTIGLLNSVSAEKISDCDKIFGTSKEAIEFIDSI